MLKTTCHFQKAGDFRYLSLTPYPKFSEHTYIHTYTHIYIGTYVRTDRQADVQTNSAFIPLCVFYLIVMIIKVKH
jgi:hypothetical protein